MEKGVINKVDSYYEYDARVVWEKIEPGINSILNQDTSWLTMRSEDVYNECINGSCRIWSPENHNLMDVFGITKVEVCPYRLNRTLILLIAWSTANDRSVADTFNSLMTKVAIASGCIGIEFWTPSVKIADYAVSKGFNKRIHVCRRNLNTKWEKNNMESNLSLVREGENLNE
jgi:hypothetical protein